MVVISERCYKIHQIMFMAMGFWPYQKPFTRRLQALFICGICCMNALFQLTAFLTTTCNMDCILKRFSYICLSSVYVICYCSFYFNPEVLKQSLKHVQLDWKMFENSDTIKIFEEYLFLAYVFEIFACIIIPAVISAYVTLECKPVILDAIIPMNVSRPRKTEVDYEMFLNEQDYYFLYILQEGLGTMLGFYSILVPAAFCFTLTRHCCAGYKIASCVIQNTAIAHTLQMPVSHQIQLMHRNISFSVYLHRRTLKLMKNFLNAVDMWYFPLLLICVLCLSCVLLRMYNTVLHSGSLYDAFVCSLLLATCFTYMFITNVLAQIYTDHSVLILKSIHDTLWYIAPIPIQKLFLFMETSIKSHIIMMGGLFALSTEGFATLLTSAISYFTVLHTMHS